MARGIDTVVTLFETVANAMTVKNNVLPTPGDTTPTFIYNRVSGINENPSKTYPAILLDAQPNIDRIQIATNFLPRVNCYEFKLFVYDTYNFNQQKVTDLSLKQEKVETIINQYIAEVQRVALNVAPWNGYGIEIKNIRTVDGFFGKDVHNSKLVQVYYKILVTIGTDCELGTFNYV